MKKLLVVIGVLLLVSVSAAAKPTFYNFSFDGFCDGMSLVLYSPGVGIPKVFVAGVRTGCVADNVGGFKTGITKTIVPFRSPVLNVSIGGSYSYSLIYLIQPKGLGGATSCAWANYYSPDGVGNYLLNSGTCSTTAPDKKATKSSGSIQ
jgi:hypothetical protein